ncbi:hypothetical protein ASF10_12805 [Flavobacterium sp. Leaf82]|jgi:hypothetical protein|uniref:hypothetical protein n=1 Tax=unclassified Flavobacterium TaxID=196869 RepID=UPI0006FBDD43|nr:hypothetical protein [Flavobacterium sp. Leaf82]KQO21625.1 hypothetical protein ASF10_12805 [Flavobacterium sp. Leaf82]
MNKKSLSLLLIIFCFITGFTHAQQLEERRVKIEITLIEGNKSITAVARTVAFSFTRPTAIADGPQKNYYLSIDFEKLDVNLLRAFARNKNGIDGQLTMVDLNGKTPSRKYEFKAATLDALSDQLNGDYSSTYFSLNCASLIIDGVTIE